MLWPDEVRDARSSRSWTRTSRSGRRSSQMASSLIETMARRLRPVRVQGRLPRGPRGGHRGQDRGRGGRPAAGGRDGDPAATDLLSALRASVEAAKKGRSAGTAKKPAGTRKRARQDGGETEDGGKDRRRPRRRAGPRARPSPRAARANPPDVRILGHEGMDPPAGALRRTVSFVLQCSGAFPRRRPATRPRSPVIAEPLEAGPFREVLS